MIPEATASELGRRIGDPEWLLPGEEPGTPDVDRAHHWMTVHGELLELRQSLLADLRRTAAQVGDRNVADGLRSNLRTLELAVNRSQRRVAFWDHRLHELAGAFAAAGPR